MWELALGRRRRGCRLNVSIRKNIWVLYYSCSGKAKIPPGSDMPFAFQDASLILLGCVLMRNLFSIILMTNCYCCCSAVANESSR